MNKVVVVLGCLVLGSLAVAGCARPELLSGTPDAAWVKEPMISFGNADTPAAEHCARYGKAAVYRGSLADDDADRGKFIGPTGTHVPILVYDCRRQASPGIDRRGS